MVDANHCYDVTDALAVGRELGQLGVAWFEEPVAPEDRDGYRRLRDSLDVNIAGGEAEFTRWGWRDLLDGRCVDIAQPEVCALGGVSEYLKVRDLAHSRFIPVVNHVWGSALAVSLNLHLLMAMPDLPGAMFPRGSDARVRHHAQSFPGRPDPQSTRSPGDGADHRDHGSPGGPRPRRRDRPGLHRRLRGPVSMSSSAATSSEAGRSANAPVRSPNVRGALMADQEDPSSGSVVCLGEAMAQIVPTDGLRLDAAQEFAVGLAGAESNVAISLARLGTPSAWAGIVGDDPLGTRLLGELLDWGVDTAQSQRAVGGGRACS